MVTALIVVGSLLMAAGIGAISISLYCAPVGYEDESGFHPGIESKPAETAATLNESVAA